MGCSSSTQAQGHVQATLPPQPNPQTAMSVSGDQQNPSPNREPGSHSPQPQHQPAENQPCPQQCVRGWYAAQEASLLPPLHQASSATATGGDEHVRQPHTMAGVQAESDTGPEEVGTNRATTLPPIKAKKADPHPAVRMLGASSACSSEDASFKSTGSDASPKTADAVQLLEAAEQGRVSMLIYYIGDHNMDVRTTNQEGDTLMMYAAGTGNVPMMEYLTQQDPELARVGNNYGMTPLHTAAVQGYVDVAKHLVEAAQVPVDHTSTDQDITPLEVAAQYENMEVAKYLLQRGARVTLVQDEEIQSKLRELMQDLGAEGAHQAVQ